MIAITEETVSQQMLDQADKIITPLEAQLSSTVQLISNAQSELVTIAAASEDRQAALIEARSTFDRLHAVHVQAVHFAKISVDTVREQQAIKAVSSAKKDLQRATQELERLERESTKEDQRAATRTQELSGLIEKWQLEQGDIEMNITNTKAARSQAHKELGKLKYGVLAQAYQDKQQQIDALKTQLVTAQAELYDLHESALSDLASWEPLQRDITRLRPIDDSTSRVLKGTISYIDTLIQDMESINHDVQYPWPTLRDVLFVREQEITDKGLLAMRKHRLEQTLDAYYAYLDR